MLGYHATTMTQRKHVYSFKIKTYQKSRNTLLKKKPLLPWTHLIKVLLIYLFQVEHQNLKTELCDKEDLIVQTAKAMESLEKGHDHKMGELKRLHDQQVIFTYIFQINDLCWNLLI